MGGERSARDPNFCLFANDSETHRTERRFYGQI
jgi:hypothetical protein